MNHSWRLSLIESIDKDEQCVFIKFCLLLGQSEEMIEDQLRSILGPKSLSLNSIRQWTSVLKESINGIKPYKIDKRIRKRQPSAGSPSKVSL